MAAEASCTSPVRPASRSSSPGAAWRRCSSLAVGATGATPTLRLFVRAVADHGRTQRGATSSTVDPGVWIDARAATTSSSGSSRPTTTRRSRSTQVDSETERRCCARCPPELMDGVGSASRTSRTYKVRDANGAKVLAGTRSSFCPNSGTGSACPTTVPLNSQLPLLLQRWTVHPTGSIWGIDDGWASGRRRRPSYYGLGWKAEARQLRASRSDDRPRPGWTSSTSAPEDAVGRGPREGASTAGPSAPRAAERRPDPSSPTATAVPRGPGS